MSGAAKRRGGREELPGDQNRGRLQVPGAYDGPGSRGGSSTGPPGSTGRRPSNAPSNAGSNAPSAGPRSPMGSPRIGAGGMGSFPGSPPGSRPASSYGGAPAPQMVDPARDRPVSLTDMVRNLDLPGGAFNLDKFVSFRNLS